MGKNIVICCDGTSNQYAQDKTNVVKLYSTLLDDGRSQVTFYHPGVGTMGPPGALTDFDRWWTVLFGLAFGYGLESDIRDAYVFLMKNFQPGDHVYLFGFSRGAYTARSLASVLYMYGLIRLDNDTLVPYAIRMMERVRSQGISAVLELASGFKGTFSQECKPWFVGVWDTVSSVGWIANPLVLPFTANNPDIEYGRHAIAIDERRAFFRPNLWRWNADAANFGPKNLKQVWFPGSHSDVGGGYPERESGQSKYALEWMMTESRACGLAFDNSKARYVLGSPPNDDYVPPSVDQPLHESLTAKWWPAEFVLKKHYDWQTGRTELRVNAGRRRQIPQQALVHASVSLRGAQYRDLLPPTAIQEPCVAF